VDAYTRRILARHGQVDWRASYEEIQSLFVRELPRNSILYNEYHALLVALGKAFCRRTQPRCPACPLRRVGRITLEQSATLCVTRG